MKLSCIHSLSNNLVKWILFCVYVLCSTTLSRKKWQLECLSFISMGLGDNFLPFNAIFKLSLAWSFASLLRTRTPPRLTIDLSPHGTIWSTMFHPLAWCWQNALAHSVLLIPFVWCGDSHTLAHFWLYTWMAARTDPVTLSLSHTHARCATFSNACLIVSFCVVWAKKVPFARQPINSIRYLATFFLSLFLFFFYRFSSERKVIFPFIIIFFFFFFQFSILL